MLAAMYSSQGVVGLNYIKEELPFYRQEVRLFVGRWSLTERN